MKSDKKIRDTNKKHIWIIAVPVCAILCFVVWQVGQAVGVDLGEFIYNVTH